MNGTLASIFVATAASGIGIASLLWAMRVTDGVRGSLRQWKDRVHVGAHTAGCTSGPNLTPQGVAN